MGGSKRKRAAEKFVRSMAASNEYHAQYLNDTDFYNAYDRFTRWQLNYLLPFFEDLMAIEGYADAINFVMSDLAGVGVSERDRDIQRAARVISASLPEQALVTLASAAELNEQVLRINLAICRQLVRKGIDPAEMSATEYCIACRGSSTFEECESLVQTTVRLGATLKTLVRVPLIGWTLRAMNKPAHAAGFGALQEFLETGFRTFEQIPAIDHFLEQIERRMTEVFSLIYTAPLAELENTRPACR